jgi:hypothetical protein
LPRYECARALFGRPSLRLDHSRAGGQRGFGLVEVGAQGKIVGFADSRKRPGQDDDQSEQWDAH